MNKLDGRKLDHQTLEAIRIRAVQQVEAGESPEAVIKALGFTLWVANCNFARKNGQMTNLAPAGCLPYPVEL